MWSKLARAYRKLEDEQIMVLENPAVLASLTPAWGARSLEFMAQMSALERADLLAYSRKYHGWRGLIPLAQSVLGMNVVATMLHWTVPNTLPSIWPLLIGASVVGFIGFYMWFAVWYCYRRMLANRHMVYVCVLMFIGINIGEVAGTFIFQGRNFADLDWSYIRWSLGKAFWVGAVILTPPLIAAMRNRRYEQLTEKLNLAERERLARELSESQLRLLRAQIEPHFLFNTLGAVQQLAERDAPRAAELTANLIAFLRASFTEMRSDSVTLGADFGLIKAYLNVMQVRLGSRLTFTLDVPPELAGISVPSMMLLTLVENAIKHGIEPSLRGGAVMVSAQQQGAAVRIRVQDTGVGLPSTLVLGNGLDNLHKRIQLCYAGKGAATLVLSAPEDGGTIADLTLPLPLQKDM